MNDEFIKIYEEIQDKHKITKNQISFFIGITKNELVGILKNEKKCDNEVLEKLKYLNDNEDEQIKLKESIKKMVQKGFDFVAKAIGLILGFTTFLLSIQGNTEQSTINILFAIAIVCFGAAMLPKK